LASLPAYREISYFQFEVPNGFNPDGDLDLTVGDCILTMKTIQRGLSSVSDPYGLKPHGA
jgi:hypothetical protein